MSEERLNERELTHRTHKDDYLVVWFCKIIQRGDVVQKDAEFWREMFQHKPVVIPLLNRAHLFLGSKEKRNRSQFLLAATH